MLLAIREKAQGWLAWVIVGFISIPFALWGISSYLEGGSSPAAANINGVEISQRDLQQRVQEVRDNLRNRLGASYRSELFDDAVIRQQAMQQMINESVLETTSGKWKMAAGDGFVRSYIQSIPAFQTDGMFDATSYSIAVRNRGMSERGFEEGLRQDLIMSQLRNGIRDSVFITDRALTDAVKLTNQEREVAYLQISADKLGKNLQSSTDEQKEYYNQNTSAYIIPERVKVEYILLDPEALATNIEVTDDLLRDYYEQHTDEFQVPEERQVRHILISVSETAEQALIDTAESKAKALLARINAGEDFAVLAKEFSDDSGSAEQGGDVGWVIPGLMAKAFEDKAFELDIKVVSEPVRTPFGYHLIEVTEIKNGGQGNFDQLRAEIEIAYTRAQGEKIFFDQAETLADLSYETPDSLLPTAEVLGLPVQESDWFNRTDGQGDLASSKVAAAAFSDDVMTEGNNSELLELDQDKVMVLRVVEHEVEQVQPFDDVLDQVIASLKKQKSASLAEAEGKRLLVAIEAGETTMQAAAESGEWLLATKKMLKRRDTTVPSAITDKAFKLLQAEGKAAYTGTALASGDYAVLALSAVKDGDVSAMDEAAKTSMQQRMQQKQGNAGFLMMTDFLRSQADIELAQ